jgi:anti-sigma regulatory factor (Ser/Thr protein kinase)
VPSASADARHAVRDFCVSGSLAGVADDAELLTSEVVTNAVRHATSLITVLVVQRDAALVVSVNDDGDSDVHLAPGTPSTSEENGRGVFLVDTIASDWGVSRHADGKAVWFRLP